MIIRKLVFLSVCVVIVSPGLTAGCRSPTESATQTEHIGQTSQGLTVNTNVQVMNLFGRHETAVTYTPGNGNGPTWIVSWNGQGLGLPVSGIGWVSSANTAATAWNAPTETTNGIALGNPITSPYWTSQGYTVNLNGYAGDTSLAPVTDPSVSLFGTAAMIATLGNAPNPISGVQEANDVVVAATFDGGHTFKSGAFVNDASTASDQADAPKLATSPLAPYDTYVSWHTRAAGWMRRIWYDSSQTFHMDPYGAIQIPGVNDTPGFRFDLSFIKLPTGCTTGGEGVAVVYVDNDLPRCDDYGFDGGRHHFPVAIYLAVWDTASHVWYGPWLVYNDVAHDACVGDPPTASNVNDPHIAGDPSSGRFFISHTVTSETLGSRAWVTWSDIVCASGTGGMCAQGQPCPANYVFVPAPDPPTGVRGDDWLPTIAFSKRLGTSRIVQHFYSARDDVNNTATRPYYRYSEDAGATWTAPLILDTYIPGGGTWWPVQASLTWDYQTLAGSYYDGSFLAVWAGDARQDRNNPRMYSALIHP